MKTLFKILAKNILFYICLFTLCISSILYSFENLYIKYLIDNLDRLLTLSLFLILIVIIRIICKYIYILFSKILQNHCMINLSNKIIDKIMNMDYTSYVDNSTGELINISKNRVENVALDGTYFIFSIFDIFFNFLFLFASIFIINKFIAIIFFIIFSISVILIFNITKLFNKYNKVLVKLDSKLLNKINNIVLGFENIILFNTFKKEKQKYINNIKMVNVLNLKTSLIHSIINISVSIVYYCSLFSLLFSNYFFKLDLSITDIFIIIYIIDCLFNPIFSLVNLLNNIQRINVSMEKINNFLNIKNDIKDGNIKIDDFNKLEFKNVSFKYKEKYVLNNINLIINKGEKIGICGPSGNGKSTLVKLIMRYYDTEGTILINNINIKDIKLESLRNEIGLIQQTPFLFNDSILNNIKYGNNNVSFKQIINVCKQASIYDFINNLPKKFNTKVGERGLKLSNGQQQRIIIARMLLKNPDLFIFDESTSALDNENEKIIQETINKINKTCIIIAHRLSTIKNCDKIIFIKDNTIKEIGTYNELMKLKGGFYKMNKNK